MTNSEYREPVMCGSCPCTEETPASCVCDCYGCRFHCGACWCEPCEQANRAAEVWVDTPDDCNYSLSHDWRPVKVVIVDAE